jgi:hypothetical protein
MAMNPITYIAVDENKYINENQQQEEQTKYRTKNIVPIIKKDCERWFENREFNINTERFAISFSNEALKQININDLIEKKSLINKNKKLQKSLIKFGEISQKDYQLFLNNTRKIINEIDKEIVLRVETYVSEHYSNILQNNTFNDIEKPKFWSSKSCLEDGKIDGALISKNMIVKGLKKEFN